MVARASVTRYNQNWPPRIVTFYQAQSSPPTVWTFQGRMGNLTDKPSLKWCDLVIGVKFLIIFLSEEKWKKTKSVLDVSQEGLRQNFVTTHLDQTRAGAGKY